MPNPLEELGKNVGTGLNVPNVGSAPILQIDPLAKSVQSGPGTLEGQVIAPPSPNIALAIKRAQAWMKERSPLEPQTVLQKNIKLMLRGGPMAEAIAKHILKMFQAHPSEAIAGPSKTIEGKAE